MVVQDFQQGREIQQRERIDQRLDVGVDGVQAKVSYQGLAPQLAGLYQLNVTIPAGVTTGSSVVLEISTVDADNVQAVIPIAK